MGIVDCNQILTADVVDYRHSAFSLGGNTAKVTWNQGLAIHILKLSEKYFILLDGQRRYIADGVNFSFVI